MASLRTTTDWDTKEGKSRREKEEGRLGENRPEICGGWIIGQLSLLVQMMVILPTVVQFEIKTLLEIVVNGLDK